VSDYTTPDAIAQALNTTFTPAQEAEALLAAHAVTEWIDDRTGRTWQGPSTITAEYHDACSVKLWMRTTPVATIDLVEYFSSDGWIVVDPSAYVLVDPRSGLVAYYGAGPVRVSYTTASETLPAPLERAATQIAADMLSTTLTPPELQGVESIAVGQNDINVKLASTTSSASPGGATFSAIAIVHSYARGVIA